MDELKARVKDDAYVVDEDAWHTAMLRRDQLYAPMLAALDDAIAGLADDDPRRLRLVLTREFLVFVDEQLSDLARKWESRRRELERQLR